MRTSSSRASLTAIDPASVSGSSSSRMAGEISGRMLSMRRSRVFIGGPVRSLSLASALLG